MVIFKCTYLRRLEKEKKILNSILLQLQRTGPTLIDLAEKWPRSANIASVPDEPKKDDHKIQQSNTTGKGNLMFIHIGRKQT